MAPLVGCRAFNWSITESSTSRWPSFEAQRFMARLYSPILMSIAVASPTFRLLLPD
jgi:hypothetical protein